MRKYTDTQGLVSLTNLGVITRKNSQCLSKDPLILDCWEPKGYKKIKKKEEEDKVNTVSRENNQAIISKCLFIWCVSK